MDDRTKQPFELFGMPGARARIVCRNQPFVDELRERFLERDRAAALGDRDLLMQMLQRVLADVLARAVPNHQQLGGRHTAAAGTRQQRLRQHRAERHRQVLADRRLPLGRKRIGHARHGRRHVRRMQRREDQMPCLPRRQRDLHRLRIAHLANHDHIGRLAERGAQRGWKVRRVDADFDLLDHALLMRVLVFDRIFDRDDVLRVAPVDLVDERGDGRRLSRAGRAADEDETVMQPRDLLDLRRKPQLGEQRRLAPAAREWSPLRARARDAD